MQAGYYQKDKDKDWYEQTAKGISQAQLEHAVDEYDKKKITFWDGKNEIRKTALFADAYSYRWFTRKFPGQIPPCLIGVLVMMLKAEDFYPNQQWVLLPQGIQRVAKAEEMRKIVLKPQSAERRDVMLIFFADIKGSLFWSDVEDNINQAAMKMGPIVTYGDCAQKRTAC